MRYASVLLALFALAARAHGQPLTAAEYDRRVAEAKAKVAAMEAGTTPVAAPSPVRQDGDLNQRLAELERELQQMRRDAAPAGPSRSVTPPRDPWPGAQGTPDIRPAFPTRPPQVGECKQPIPWEKYEQFFRGSPYQPAPYQPPPYPPPGAPQQPAPPQDDSKRLHVPNPDGNHYFVCDPYEYGGGGYGGQELSIQFSRGGYEGSDDINFRRGGPYGFAPADGDGLNFRYRRGGILPWRRQELDFSFRRGGYGYPTAYGGGGRYGGLPIYYAGGPHVHDPRTGQRINLNFSSYGNGGGGGYYGGGGGYPAMPYSYNGFGGSPIGYSSGGV